MLIFLENTELAAPSSVTPAGTVSSSLQVRPLARMVWPGRAAARASFTVPILHSAVSVAGRLVVDGGKDVIYIESGSPYFHLFSFVDKSVVGKQFIDEHAFCARKGSGVGRARLSREMHGLKTYCPRSCG